MTWKIGSLLLALLAACASPDLGTEWECRAVFVCDDRRFDITPAHGCADDELEALDAYAARLEELTADATCATRSFEDVSCENTRRICR